MWGVLCTLVWCDHVLEVVRALGAGPVVLCLAEVQEVLRLVGMGLHPVGGRLPEAEAAFHNPAPMMITIIQIPA